GQPRHRRLLRARQGEPGEDHRPRAYGAAQDDASGPAGRQVDSPPMTALPLLIALLAQDTGAAAPLLEKGEQLFRQGDTAGALGAFQKAAKAEPGDARPHYLAGVALEKKGDAAGATAEYRKAVGLKSDFPEARNNLGALLIAAGDAAGAARAGGGGPDQTRLRRGPVQ